MNKLRLFLSAMLLLPLLAFGASLGSAGLGQTPDEVIPQEIGGSSSYQCCWIFFMGKWWCTPCG